MEMNNYKIGSSDIFSSEEVNLIKKVVLEAGEVDENTFNNLLAKNPVLILYPEAKNVKAVGALKIPNDSYKKKVFHESNSELNPDDYRYELGWIVSLENGNGKQTTEILARYESKMYATIRDENLRMISIIESLGFKKIGQSYKSNRGNYRVGLYTKDK